ncbi:Leucine-rich repeat-containing protein 47 [Trichinella pseudospiralis]|uniref:Probable ribosome biogenesis protein RLP24 n=1 Tax=Trichinella pseudospiralis TaxID=6337 RepID=A0A0V1EV62_TRIPS|nr:Leucine-rich repeat-containing protein 47 [Trichinella pseudospiralis]KRZ30619.1 Leucine-rich repeat-containing protein 47 [Trichinella pseudospiralis]KRZ43826.1 Leucine-rich repeat-containing protein 47 [Trichinella pseudospiralis]
MSDKKASNQHNQKDGQGQDGRHELKLTGSELNKMLDQETCTVPASIFKKSGLNFIELSYSNLSEIPNEIGNASSLINLVLRNNKLTSLPDCIGQLKRLKNLDLSWNKLTSIPSTLVNCSQLQLLNVSGNCLTKLDIQFDQLSWLIHVDASHNQLVEFPNTICSFELIHLTEILLKSNKIESIPKELEKLPMLKVLDLSENQIKHVPRELSSCSKLRELLLNDNPLKDRRLLKLLKEGQTKVILDYIKKNRATDEAATDKSNSGKKPATPNKGNDLQEEKKKLNILVKPSDESNAIIWCNSVANVRPYLVCCIVRGLDFSDSNKKKQFITMQSKLHFNVCNKRILGTIATHDLANVRFPLKYTALHPEKIKIKPLNRTTELTAAKLMSELKAGAEALRKEKKRNVHSGIHQYIYLLAKKSTYPCLIDAEGTVISLPPLTNGDVTKISPETKDILVEVSSAESFASCIHIMQEFMKALVDYCHTCSHTENENLSELYQEISVQQIKVLLENEQTIKSVYPITMRLEKCYFCSSTIYPGHGIMFVRNDCKIFRFCRSKCHKSFKMKRNPRKFGWTKAGRKVMNKDLSNDLSLEFEKRRNEPQKYDRNVWNKTIDIMKKVESVKQKRQALFIKNRLKAGIEMRKERDQINMKKNIHLLKSPAAMMTFVEEEVSDVKEVPEKIEIMEEN